jgi:hypothetical protein
VLHDAAQVLAQSLRCRGPSAVFQKSLLRTLWMDVGLGLHRGMGLVEQLHVFLDARLEVGGAPALAEPLDGELGGEEVEGDKSRLRPRGCCARS